MQAYDTPHQQNGDGRLQLRVIELCDDGEHCAPERDSAASSKRCQQAGKPVDRPTDLRSMAQLRALAGIDG
jgi:hypothetical protein